MFGRFCLIKGIKMSTTKFLGICLICLIANGAAIANTQENSEIQEQVSEVEKLSSRAPAIAIERVPPNYPIDAARYGEEGWVQLSFVISDKGRVEDVEVIANGGSRSFILPARKALKKWRYTPAKNSKGESILSCQNTVQLDFKMAGGDVVTEDFLELLKASFNAINTKNIESLEILVEDVEDYPYKRTSELAWNHFIEMRYFELINDNKNYLKAVNKASSYVRAKQPIFTEPAALNILQNHFTYQVEQQLYHNATNTFTKLKEFDSPYAQKLIANFQPIMQQIDRIVSGDKNILIKGKIKSGLWHHTLMRKKFLLSNIDGDLDKVEIRCDYKKEVYSVAENTIWRIPKNWGQCDVLVKGNKGANFDLYELPSNS